jgi:hypothetical protein
MLENHWVETTVERNAPFSSQDPVVVYTAMDKVQRPTRSGVYLGSPGEMGSS